MRRIEFPRRRGFLSPAAGPLAGEEAAQRTDRLLQRLPRRDWQVVDDGRHTGLDHVIVGPAGVLAVASCCPAGVGAARVKDGMLWLRRTADSRADKRGAAINRDVLESAKALHKQIRSRTERGPEVRPVVVLWCDFPQTVAESGRMTFVQGRELLGWISRRPVKLDAIGRSEVGDAVRAICGERTDGDRMWPGRRRRDAA